MARSTSAPPDTSDSPHFPQYEVKHNIDLAALFLSMQEELAARFRTSRDFVNHRPIMGAAAEHTWLALLHDYLPQRYTAGSAFVVDHRGEISDQIDVVIYDRQYSPLIFRQQGVLYVPAESVYAVFDVKQQLTRETVDQAAAKAQSVRRLKRTSATITHAGGTYKPRPPFPILAGVLSLSSLWSDGVGESLTRVLNQFTATQMLDVGCAVDSGAFETTVLREKVKVEVAPRESALIFFLVRLLNRLQQLGTAPAIDLLKYTAKLTTRTADPGPQKPKWRK